MPTYPHNRKVKRGGNPPPKIALFGERTSKTFRESFPARAERVEFLRKRIDCYDINFAQKEGRIAPQALAVKVIAVSRLCFMVLILQGG